MGQFYGRKILNGVTNPKTGKPWSLDDVGDYWKPRVIKWLEENGYVFPEEQTEN